MGNDAAINGLDDLVREAVEVDRSEIRLARFSCDRHPQAARLSLPKSTNLRYLSGRW
jgi:hypothetical protein